MTHPALESLFGAQPQGAQSALSKLFGEPEEEKKRFRPGDVVGSIARGAQNLLAGQLAGAGGAATKTLRGVGELAQSVPDLPIPGRSLISVARAIPTERLREREQILAAAVPENTAGRIGAVGGGLGFTLASMLLASGAGTARTAGAAAVRGALGSVPISASQAQADEEFSTAAALADTFDSDILRRVADDPRKRAAFEAAFDLALGAAGESVAFLARSKSAAKELAEQTARRIESETEGLQRIGATQRDRAAAREGEELAQQQRLAALEAEPQSRAAREAQEFNRAMTEGQAVAEQKAASRAELPPSLRGAVDRLFSNERGAVDIPPGGVLPTLATTSGGALTGAALDEENRGRGAVLGGLAGLGVGAGVQLGPQVLRRAVGAADEAAPLGREAGALRVSDVPPKTGPEDFDVTLSNVTTDAGRLAELAGRAGKLKETGELVNQPVSWNQTRGDARGVDVDSFIREPGNRATTGAEGLQLREQYNEQLTSLSKVYQQADQLPVQSAERFALNEQILEMERRADDILKTAVRGASQQGRDFNALKILANQTTDPFVWSAKIQRVMGLGNEMPAGIRKQIFDLSEKGDRLGLANLAQELQPPTTWRQMDYWSTLVRAGMLTLPVSVGRALFGNSARGIYDVAAKPATVAADVLASLITGKRTTVFGGLNGTLARVKGSIKGLRESPAALRGDIIDDTLEKFDMPRGTRLAPIWGKTSWGDAYVRYVFGSQGAIDRPFRQGVRAGSLYEQARITATTASLAEQAKILAKDVESLSGVSASKRAKELFENPTPEMVLRSVIDSEHAIFQNRTLASRAGSGVLSAIRSASPNTAAALQATALPFIRTPSSIATMALGSTPVGALSTASDVVRLWARASGKSKIKETFELQRRATQRTGRWTTGLLAVAGGYNLFLRGRMTGALPEGASEREQWQAEGKVPYAIRIGERWHPVGQIQPLGAIMAFGASLGDATSDEDRGFLRTLVDPDALAGATGASLKSLTDLPFFRGVKDVVEIINEPDRKLAKVATQKAGSLVPNIVAGAARAADPVVRDVSSVVESILSRIPYASRRLEARPGLFGETIERERGIVDRVGAAFFNVTGSRRDNTQDDALLAELQSIGFVVPRLTRGTSTPEEFRARKRFYGQFTKAAVQEILQGESYATAPQAAQWYVQSDPRFMSISPGVLSDALRREMLSDAITAVRRQLTTEIRQARAGGTR